MTNVRVNLSYALSFIFHSSVTILLRFIEFFFPAFQSASSVFFFFIVQVRNLCHAESVY